MAYIGKTPTIGNFQVCDAISVVNGQAAYTMQVGSVNVSPESANHMLVSLNGILQKAGSSFTVSGSTITFASNLVTGDVIDFIQILGNVLDLGVPSDATVSLAKLTASGTKSSSTFLRGDNTFNAPPLGGITEADEFRLTTSFTGSANPIASNLERNDNAVFSVLGTGMTENSGIFTFPSTGYWFVTFKLNISASNIDNCSAVIRATTDNFSSVDLNISESTTNPGNGGQGQNDTAVTSSLIDVTDTSNVKVKFQASSLLSGNTVNGNTNSSYTSMIFIRLGDT